MAQNEKTSARVASIASKALNNPQAVSADEIKELAASVLSQAPDQQGQAYQQKNPQNQNQSNQQNQPNQQNQGQSRR